MELKAHFYSRFERVAQDAPHHPSRAQGGGVGGMHVKTGCLDSKEPRYRREMGLPGPAGSLIGVRPDEMPGLNFQTFPRGHSVGSFCLQNRHRFGGSKECFLFLKTRNAHLSRRGSECGVVGVYDRH